jgi:hypothetical protein
MLAKNVCMLTGAIAIGGGGGGKILTWVTVTDNCSQGPVYYVEYVHVERSIELQELEGC